MDWNLFLFAIGGFVALTQINRVIGGAFISTADVAIMNNLSITQDVTVAWFSLPVPNLSFLTGILHLLKWDYSFFGGQAQIFQFMLYSVSGAIAIFLFFSIIGLGVNAIRPR